MGNLNAFIWDFFHVPGNQIIVAFGHGLVYFLMGFAVLLQSRRWRHVSDVTLAKSIAWLGLFGIVQAFAVWGLMFVPIQQTYLSPTATGILTTIQTFLVAGASALLMHFGSRLWADTLGSRARGSRLLLALAPVMLLLWTVVYVTYLFRLPPESLDDLLGAGQLMARFGMAIPGAIITCYALVLQAREFHLLRMDHLVTYLKWLMTSFALYAVTSVLLIPPTSFGLSSIVNSVTFLDRAGMPADVLAGAAGLLMTIFAVRILEVFDIELGRRLDSARQMKLLLDERDRIARELHDGIIQQLYAIGLSLEAGLYALERPNGNTDQILRASMDRLDETIQDMRSYIMDLKGYAEHAELVELLRALCDQLADEYGLRVDFDSRPHDANHLSVEERSHILQIVREAVSNASRHGRADRVQVTITQQRDLLVIVQDDGRGFNVNEVWKEKFNVDEQRVHHGLRNMRHRAELLGGYLEIDSEEGKGTTVTVTVPEGVKGHG